MEQFGQYMIHRPLAEGGMAQVHVAQRTGSDKICVLKRLKVSLADRDINVKRFAREAHVVAHLRHPRIAQVTDAGTVDNAIYMAMEFIPGKEAEAIMLHLLRTGRMMPYGASILIALATLDGLAYAHDAKDAKGEALELVHRDLSPGNVMVRFDGDVKIIDFGLPRGNLDDFKTAPGMIMGTLRYMSPEQAKGLPVDRRSDLYSLSVWLWELLAGRLLLGQVDQNDWRPILTAVMNDVPPPLHTFNPNVPKALSDVVARGLALKPADDQILVPAGRVQIPDALGEMEHLGVRHLAELVLRRHLGEAVVVIVNDGGRLRRFGGFPHRNRLGRGLPHLGHHPITDPRLGEHTLQRAEQPVPLLRSQPAVGVDALHPRLQHLPERLPAARRRLPVAVEGGDLQRQEQRLVVGHRP